MSGLSRWLILVACLRSLPIYVGYFDPDVFRKMLIDAQPDLVNDLYGRLLATWTVLNTGLCLICARNISNAAIYGATLLSFVVALAHFLGELFVFKTITIKGAAIPMAFAGISIVWMSAGWSFHTQCPATSKEQQQQQGAAAAVAPSTAATARAMPALAGAGSKID